MPGTKEMAIAKPSINADDLKKCAVMTFVRLAQIILGNAERFLIFWILLVTLCRSWLEIRLEATECQAKYDCYGIFPRFDWVATVVFSIPLLEGIVAGRASRAGNGLHSGV